MQPSVTLIRLALLVACLAAIAAGVGLFWQNGESSFPFTTLHGETVTIYGQGLYRYDTPLIAIGYKVADGFTLLAGIPLLLVALGLYRHGSVRGGFLLAGAFAYFFYNYFSLAIGAAYNNLLLVYILLSMAAFFGLAITLRALNSFALEINFSEKIPQRSISIFLIVSGIILFLIWLVLSILPALLTGGVPGELDSYTTVITFVLDMGLLAPLLIVAGILLQRRDPLGYLLVPVLLVFVDALGLSLLAMGIAQQLAGLMHIGQFIGFVVSFAILTLFSLGFSLILFRNFPETEGKPA